MKIIYEPTGPAAEYDPLAATLYKGCGHGCKGCFAPLVMHMKREQFHHPQVRNNVINDLERDARELSGRCDSREILMSFMTDPYQPIDVSQKLTRKAIIIFIQNDLHFTTLTKGGLRSTRDFDLTAGYKNYRYGASLTLFDDIQSVRFEPDAALPHERIEALKKAHDLGIETWVSLEPIMFPIHTLRLIEATYPFVDEYRIGKLNYEQDLMSRVLGYQSPTPSELVQFVRDAKEFLDSCGKRYMFKESMKRYLEEPGGGEGE